MKETSIKKGMKKRPRLVLNKRTVVHLNHLQMSKVGGQENVDDRSLVICITPLTYESCPSVQECPTATTHDTGIPPGSVATLYS